MTFLRSDAFARLQDQVFDICIVGGGATGAGCALDAASRGYKVLLVEKEDFGGATSSKSTKLIHGGVRYLEQAVKKLSLEQYRMVKKALQERSTLLTIAPHITKPLQLITPCRTWIEGAYYYIGLKMYDWISGRTNLGGSELLGRKKAMERIPTLRKEQLFNAVLYYDGQLDDLRFNLALIQTAMQEGALCINHTSLQAFHPHEKSGVKGFRVVDELTGKSYEGKAKVIINATGPFADRIRLLANPALKPRMRVSKGVHILLPKPMMSSNSALLIPQTRDGRVLFAIPYQKHLLVGTTDDETELTDEDFGPTHAEVKYLLEYINEYLDVKATPEDVGAGFGGLRPLVMKRDGKSKDLVRDHEVEFDSQSGLLSILGGKWTTYRLMAKDTIDAAEKMLGVKNICTTQHIILVGSQHYNHNTAIVLHKQTGCDHEIVKHLVSKYGDKSGQIAKIMLKDALLKERILPGMPYTWAELQYVIQEEMAYTVKDILCSRWGTQLADWQQTLSLIEPVGDYLAQKYDWTTADKQKHIEQYRQEILKMQKAMHQ